jgi:antibiotic biosynthesis monooxygenase (ABM) superfamily enzyme
MILRADQITHIQKGATMAKARVLNIVATECAVKNDARFNEWYNEVHIPLLMKYEGIKRVTRYKILDEKKKKPRYIAIYEFDTKEDLNGLPTSSEFKAAIKEMQETWKDEMVDIKWAVSCEPIQTWEA